MWSDKYEDEKKRSGTLELQLKEMSNQLDDYDKKFQTLRTDSTHAELIELQAQIEELNIERDDLHDETDSLRTQLLVNITFMIINSLFINNFIIRHKQQRFTNYLCKQLKFLRMSRPILNTSIILKRKSNN